VRAGGIGKTRLALRMLATVAAAPDGEFPDGVCFVELGDLREADLVPSRVAAALGVSEEPGRASARCAPPSSGATSC
jgi:predicted ATPase